MTLGVAITRYDVSSAALRRDWVHRYNACGIASLSNIPGGGRLERHPTERDHPSDKDAR